MNDVSKLEMTNDSDKKLLRFAICKFTNVHIICYRFAKGVTQLTHNP